MNCKAPHELCQRCGQNRFNENNEEHECARLASAALCRNCGGGHPATDKGCPRRAEEQKIRNEATIRGISVSEMKKLAKNTISGFSVNSRLQFPPLKSQEVSQDADHVIPNLSFSQIAKKTNSTSPPHEARRHMTQEARQSSSAFTWSRSSSQPSVKTTKNVGRQTQQPGSRNTHLYKPSEKEVLFQRKVRDALICPNGRGAPPAKLPGNLLTAVTNEWNGSIDEGEMQKHIKLLEPIFTNNANISHPSLLQAFILLYEKTLSDIEKPSEAPPLAPLNDQEMLEEVDNCRNDCSVDPGSEDLQLTQEIFQEPFPETRA
ncbi:hypothetical protein QAD02_017997 [Eretmocerus hayati]|uniref:Uncharacterized protein n=1 Tax=Eretmocerus hayati TaxID=131215 RepID=A0ACC2PFJ8_9HYME|nr:hypothetical protein QAD02_017997 [Eretmocerus hayati]